MPTSPGILKTPIINNVNTLIGMFKLKYDPIKLNKTHNPPLMKINQYNPF